MRHLFENSTRTKINSSKSQSICQESAFLQSMPRLLPRVLLLSVWLVCVAQVQFLPLTSFHSKSCYCSRDCSLFARIRWAGGTLCLNEKYWLINMDSFKMPNWIGYFSILTSSGTDNNFSGSQIWWQTATAWLDSKFTLRRFSCYWRSDIVVPHAAQQTQYLLVLSPKPLRLLVDVLH